MIIQEYIDKGLPIKLDLGCGPNKKPGYIGVDILPLDGVDIQYDFDKDLHFLPDNSVTEITSSHLLEHIEDLGAFMKEVHRVLKSDGIMVIIVPHFSNPYYYSDYTHKRFFGLYSMDYFSDGNNAYSRKVPTFYDNAKFVVVNRKLRFSSFPFYWRNKIKALWTKIFNASVYMQELYEDAFTGIIPCAEVHFTVRPIK